MNLILSITYYSGQSGVNILDDLDVTSLLERRLNTTTHINYKIS